MSFARFAGCISRAAVTDGGMLTGYAAVYDQPTNRQGDYAGTESIARGAFDGVLGDDVLATVEHDPTKLLGRSASGTLRLSSDDEGLRFEIDLPDTQLGHDVRVMVDRGDLPGASFMARPSGIERTAGGVVHRAFSRLVDVTITAIPAYLGTHVVARSEDLDPANLRVQLLMARHRARGGK